MNQEGKAPYKREDGRSKKKADHKSTKKKMEGGRKNGIFRWSKRKNFKSRIFNYAKSKGFVGDYETEYGGF